MREIIPGLSDRLPVSGPLSALHGQPAVITAAGERATYRFLEFFTARIRNPHTRRSYGRAVGDFCAWLQARGLRDITQVNSFVVAAWVEHMQQEHPAPTVK